MNPSFFQKTEGEFCEQKWRLLFNETVESIDLGQLLATPLEKYGIFTKAIFLLVSAKQLYVISGYGLPMICKDEIFHALIAPCFMIRNGACIFCKTMESYDHWFLY